MTCTGGGRVVALREWFMSAQNNEVVAKETGVKQCGEIRRNETLKNGRIYRKIIDVVHF